MGFADQLWASEVAMEEAILAHPFVRGLGDGTLPTERYRFYLCQDYAFLREYARVLALGVAAAEVPGDMAAWSEMLHATLTREMELHRESCEGFGITRLALETVTLAPFAFHYTRHLLAVARAGGLGEIAAALLPCQRGYAVIGEALRCRGLPPVEAYAAWITAYADPTYQRAARWMWDQVNRQADEMGRSQRARAAAAFAASMRYEHDFWDGCWRGPEGGAPGAPDG